MSALDAALLEAHAQDDKPALVALYAQAAEQANDDIARAFFLTHAYVFALEVNDPAQAELGRVLRGMGRL